MSAMYENYSNNSTIQSSKSLYKFFNDQNKIFNDYTVKRF